MVVEVDPAAARPAPPGLEGSLRIRPSCGEERGLEVKALMTLFRDPTALATFRNLSNIVVRL